MQNNPTLNSSELVRHIGRYAALGYATFPTQNKRPTTSGESWKTSQVEVHVLPEKYPRGEYGVVLREDDLVVDIDPRNFPPGRRVWSELKLVLALPADIEKSFVVKTTSGGMHLYLRKPPGFPIRKHLKNYPGIDFLTAGNYVIGAGSIVPAKDTGVLGEYEIVSDCLVKDAPIALLNALAKPIEEYQVAGDLGFRDTPDNLKGFAEYLTTVAEPAIEGRAGDQVTFKIACRGRDFNLSQDACFKMMFQYYNPRCIPEWTAEELKSKIRNAYTYNSAPPGVRDPFAVFPDMTESVEEDRMQWMKLLDIAGKSGEYKPTLNNCVLFLKNDKNHKGAFGFNLFSYKLELVRKLPWEKMRFNSYRQINDLEVGHVSLYLAQTYRVEFPVPKVWEALAIVANEKAHHPIKDMLAGLKWDGVARLDKWLTTYCGVVESTYSKAVGRKTLVGAIARVFDPGCKFDFVLVLEGAQGVGKSTICRILGGEYFGDAPIDIHNLKDAIQYVHAHWIIEFAEMVSVRKADINKLKQFIVAQEDEARPAYARASMRFARQSIFIGTINPDAIGYLIDDTGNRRFWPVACGRCDTAALRRDRDQLFAEAKHLYEKGEQLYLPDELTGIAAHEAKERLIKDPWTAVIYKWVAENPEIAEVTTEMVFSVVIGGSYLQMNTGHARRIVAALKSAGFELKPTPNGNKYVRIMELPAQMPVVPQHFGILQKI